MSLLEEFFSRHLVGLSSRTLTVLSACALGGRSILLIGEHGCGKTTFCSLVAEFFGWEEHQWVHYNATVDDMVTVMGLPDVNVEPGKPLRFIPHARAIWDKRLVLIDELTRAAPENQNMWLEIVSQGTLKGRKLPCRLLVATCNPSTYAGAFELDQALLDRFAVVCPFPTAATFAPRQWYEGAWVNFSGKETSLPDLQRRQELIERFHRLRTHLAKEKFVLRQIAIWAGELCHWLCSKAQVPISGRTGMQLLPELVLDLTAYYCLKTNQENQKLVVIPGEVFRTAAQFALREKLSIDPQLFQQALQHAREILQQQFGDNWEWLLDCLVSAPKEQRLQTLFQYFARHPACKLSARQRTQLQMAMRDTIQQCRGWEDGLARLVEFCRQNLPDLAGEAEWVRLQSLLETCIS